MFKAVSSIAISLTALCLLGLGLMLSFSATTPSPPPITPQDISKLKQILTKSNPFEFQRYKHQALIFDEPLLNQSVNLALKQNTSISIRINLNKNLAHITGSIKLFGFPLPLYLNFSADISPSENLINITNVRLGSLSVPEWLLNQLTPQVMQYTAKHHQDYMSLFDTVKKIDIAENRLIVNYHWNIELSKKLKIAGRNFLLPVEQQKRLRVYYEALVNLSKNKYWHAMGLQEIIQPMFSLAKKRTESGGNPIKENEAAILAMGIMASGIRVNHLLDDQKSPHLRKAVFFRLALLNRRDLMQHFLISAALTVSTNIALSDSIGLSKELDDSKGRSGFSFADLLADRAGTKFAQMVSLNKLSAVKFQQRLSLKTLKELDFMPPHDKLPESISELEFKNRYIDIQHERYLFVEKELRRRIDERSLYK